MKFDVYVLFLILLAHFDAHNQARDWFFVIIIISFRKKRSQRDCSITNLKIKYIYKSTTNKSKILGIFA